MNDAWIIVPASVTFDDLQDALTGLGDAVSLSPGPLSTQMRIADKEPLPSGHRAPDDRIEIEHPETVAELEQDDPVGIRSVVPDPVFYALRYHGVRLATKVLRSIASSRLAEGPLLIRLVDGLVFTPKDFLWRVEQDPEWWDWWKTDSTASG